MEIKTALARLDACVGHLTPQQYKTLRGQILAGDAVGALMGLQRLLERRRKKIREKQRKNTKGSRT